MSSNSSCTSLQRSCGVEERSEASEITDDLKRNEGMSRRTYTPFTIDESTLWTSVRSEEEERAL